MMVSGKRLHTSIWGISLSIRTNSDFVWKKEEVLEVWIIIIWNNSIIYYQYIDKN